MVVYLNENRTVVEKMTRMANAFEAHNGHIETCDLWREVDGQLSHPNEVRESLRHMEQFWRVLKSLTSTYESHISDVRAHVSVPRLTPASLPEDIILLILERAAYDLHSLIKYSHVCSRIRNVILGNPFLWARFTLVNKLPILLINAIARRSGDLGLVMKIVLHESTYDWPQDKLLRVLEIFKYCHKWTSASFSINEYVAKELERRFPTGEHTLLHTLQLSDDGLTHPLPSTLFYRNWSFPALNKCNLFHQDLDLPDLITFLASAPNLSYLDLHMRTLKNTLFKFQEVILLRLEHLKIRTSSDSSSAIGDLHEAIACPSLKCITLSLSASEWKYNEVMKGVRKCYPSLVSFSLLLCTYGTGTGSSKEIFIDEILCSLPVTIETFKFYTCYEVDLRISRALRDGLSPRDTFYPNLKELELRYDSGRKEDFSIILPILLKTFSIQLHRFHLRYRSEKNEDAEVNLRSAGVLVDASMSETLNRVNPKIRALLSPCSC